MCSFCPRSTSPTFTLMRLVREYGCRSSPRNPLKTQDSCSYLRKYCCLRMVPTLWTALLLLNY
ncbi:hypothetical protein ANCCAN_15969 [Ancylostoma caninum]|uniref:Uncharacterized protein n=1 Tax=Ancylostoma caninum TaxID=29170 RepID=A0A368G115_ANCCA|nr:hypothetical protein ANCCAN_15969 [Ancylostoma caninum]